jgi:hypothetical protein
MRLSLYSVSTSLVSLSSYSSTKEAWKSLHIRLGIPHFLAFWSFALFHSLIASLESSKKRQQEAVRIGSAQMLSIQVIFRTQIIGYVVLILLVQVIRSLAHQSRTFFGIQHRSAPQRDRNCKCICMLCVLTLARTLPGVPRVCHEASRNLPASCQTNNLALVACCKTAHRLFLSRNWHGQKGERVRLDCFAQVVVLSLYFYCIGSLRFGFQKIRCN